MVDRKQTPDVLSDILGGGAPAPATNTSIPVSQQDGKLARQHTGKMVRRQDSKTARQPTGKTAEQPASKETGQPAGKPGKATFYLSQEALDGLDEAWLKLRKMAKAEERGSISKSAIVELAILLAIKDLQDKESRGYLASHLVGK